MDHLQFWHDLSRKRSQSVLSYVREGKEPPEWIKAHAIVERSPMKQLPFTDLIA